MAYPTGNGVEILRSGGIIDATDANTWLEFDGSSASPGDTTGVVPAHHIITILNITIFEASNASRTFDLNIQPGGSGTIRLTRNHPVGAYETFVWNDRLVLTGGDKMYFAGSSSSTFHVWYSYIDQNWSGSN